MSVGGSSNLGTLLIRRLDMALSTQASQQSQIVNATRSDAISQLADAARVNPLDNNLNRSLPESIEKAQAQVQHQTRQALDNTRLHTRPLPLPAERPTPETSSTRSAPTTLGNAAKTILALLARFPSQAPPVNGRAPLVQPGLPGVGSVSAEAAGHTDAASTQPTGQTRGASSAGPTAATLAAPLTGTAAAPNAQATLFARALSLAVQQSGLFYESHLRELAFGGRTAAQLKLEPQGQLGRPDAQTPAQTGPATQSGTPQGAAQSTDGSPAETRNASASGTTTGQAATAQAAPPSSLTGLHPETQLIVRQQLEVLASQVFGWRGEAWPEAQMEWEISRRNEQDIPDEAGSHWATRLRLTLPALGEVEARLSLHDQQVVMQLVAPQSADTLMQHDQALRSGFQEAGLTLSGLSIHKTQT